MPHVAFWPRRCLTPRGSERFVARSAGFAPLANVHDETLDLLQNHHFETNSLHTKDWKFYAKSPEGLNPDVLVTLSEEARLNCCKWTDTQVAVHWAVDNPLSAERADVREWKFRKCFSTLDARITALVRSRPAPSINELLLQFKEMAMVV